MCTHSHTHAHHHVITPYMAELPRRRRPPPRPVDERSRHIGEGHAHGGCDRMALGAYGTACDERDDEQAHSISLYVPCGARAVAPTLCHMGNAGLHGCLPMHGRKV